METATWREPEDALADMLQDLRLEDCFYAHSDLGAPWGLGFSAADGPSFHMVATGRCWLQLGADRIPLAAGDLVVLPRGRDHQLGDTSDGPATPLSSLPSQRISANAVTVRYGGAGERALLLCGGMRFAGPATHPLIQSLPDLLTLRRPSGESWLAATFGMLGAEAQAPQPGSAAVMTRLVDIIILQAVRAWLREEAAHRRGWLGALADPEIGPALLLIHRRPEENWTSGSLAVAVHLSRSVFSARFTRLVGLPPMRYLTQWRMSLACELLRAGQLSVGAVARRLGYRSEAAFSRAFKRSAQIAPGALRRGIPV